MRKQSQINYWLICFCADKLGARLTCTVVLPIAYVLQLDLLTVCFILCVETTELHAVTKAG